MYDLENYIWNEQSQIQISVQAGKYVDESQLFVSLICPETHNFTSEISSDKQCTILLVLTQTNEGEFASQIH